MILPTGISFLLHLTTCALAAERSFVHSIIEKNKLNSDTFEHCKAKGECFSGAWLGTVKHLLDNPLIERKFPKERIIKSPNLVRCEDASFYFFHHMFEVKTDPNPAWGMSPVQTIDLLDFSVLHLSTLERGQGHCIQRGTIRSQRIRERSILNADAARVLQNLRHNYFNGREKKATAIRKRAMDVASMASPSSLKELERAFSRTLVVMPFLVTTTGESGTTVANKKLYFKLCFDSIYPLFKNILGAVINKQDQKILKSARPFRDVMLFAERNNDCELPMLALLAVKRMLKTDTQFAASFDYIYFTEGDQVLVGRQYPQVFSFLTNNPYAVLTPHRLVITPPCVLHAFNRSVSQVVSVEDVQDYSCCMDRSSLGLSRIHWKSLASPATTVVQLFGLDVVAGNGDLFKQAYRICNVTERVDHCPQTVTFMDHHTGSEEHLVFAKHMKEQVKLHHGI